MIMKKILLPILLISILLLSGCGTVNINQKFYRDWTFDMSVDIESDNEMFLSTAKDTFEEIPIFEKAILLETEEGYRYLLEKVSLEEMATNEGDSLFESMGFKKEFRFPFYYYTLSLKNKGGTNSEFGSMGMSSNYIIEPFGKITDTNGIYVSGDKDKVKFNLMNSKDYYITFRDFFLFSWIGGASRILNRDAKESSSSFDTEQEGSLKTGNNLKELSNSIRELDEALVGGGQTNVDKKSAVSDGNVNSIIKEHCAREWPDEFSMRAYCEERQIEGYNSLMTTKPLGMSDSDYQIIKTHCANEWINDFNMQAYCEERQVEGWKEIQ